MAFSRWLLFVFALLVDIRVLYIHTSTIHPRWWFTMALPIRSSTSNIRVSPNHRPARSWCWSYWFKEMGEFIVFWSLLLRAHTAQEEKTQEMCWLQLGWYILCSTFTRQHSVQLGRSRAVLLLLLAKRRADCSSVEGHPPLPTTKCVCLCTRSS